MIKNPDNYVDLSNLPTYVRGIDWQNIHHLPIPFHYRGIDGVIYAEKHINRDYELISYKGEEYKIGKTSLINANIGKIFNFSTVDNYKYQIGDIIKHETKSSIKILEQTRSHSTTHTKGTKAYKVECLCCHNIFEIREGNLNKGDRCPYCSNHKVKVGFNDIAHTNPELVKYFVNPEDATKYVLRSNKYIDAICPNCNTLLGKQQIYGLLKNNVCCPVCGKGTSYPNRFIFNLLQKLNINVKTEVMFDWCQFPNYTNSSLIVHGRYDFFCKDYLLLIEVDSGLGHGRVIHSKASIGREDSIYRDVQKDKLAIEHGFNIIRIDCEYYRMEDRFTAMKQGILNSKLTSLFDISNIDWDEIDRLSQSSLLKDICDLYNDGKTTSQIATTFGLTVETIRVYLHKGEDCGLCVYGRKKKI